LADVFSNLKSIPNILGFIEDTPELKSFVLTKRIIDRLYPEIKAKIVQYYLNKQSNQCVTKPITTLFTPVPDYPYQNKCTASLHVLNDKFFAKLASETRALFPDIEYTLTFSNVDLDDFFSSDPYTVIAKITPYLMMQYLRHVSDKVTSGATYKCPEKESSLLQQAQVALKSATNKDTPFLNYLVAFFNKQQQMPLSNMFNKFVEEQGASLPPFLAKPFETYVKAISASPVVKTYVNANFTRHYYLKAHDYVRSKLVSDPTEITSDEHLFCLNYEANANKAYDTISPLQFSDPKSATEALRRRKFGDTNKEEWAFCRDNLYLSNLPLSEIELLAKA